MADYWLFRSDERIDTVISFDEMTLAYAAIKPALKSLAEQYAKAGNALLNAFQVKSDS